MALLHERRAAGFRDGRGKLQPFALPQEEKTGVFDLARVKPNA